MRRNIILPYFLSSPSAFIGDPENNVKMLDSRSADYGNDRPPSPVIARDEVLKQSNQNGFALVSALVVLLILMALSTLMYTITTKDIRVSTRMVGEYKAFAATEAGIHRLIEATNTNAGSMASYTLSNTQVDSATDPNTYYSISTSTVSGVPASLPMAGYEIGGSNSKNYGYSITNKTVTGTNTRYNSSMAVDVGIAYGPIEISTGQPAAGG